VVEYIVVGSLQIVFCSINFLTRGELHMALLNSQSYGELSTVSAFAVKRTPGKFYTVFITGNKRPGQQVGTMNSMYEIKDNAVEADYLVHNSEDVTFIPYFIKRFWEKNIVTKDKAGNDQARLVSFGWSDDVPKLDDTCRYVYVIAGALMNSSTKKIATHQKDVDDAKIKTGDPVLIYFRCDGTKFSGGMNFINALGDKAKNLPPLSDNIEFERNVVSPRRFICGAKVVSAKTDHGDKEVFEFSVDTQLPDKAVEQVMNSAMSFKTDFEKQFDKTEFVKSSGSAPKPNADAVPFAGPDAPAPESKPSTNEGDNFDLGF
jgi:hypothetical protein